MAFDPTRPIYDRTVRLFGEEPVKKLAGASVMLFGLGGVGGYVLEALCRAGIGTLILVDCDTVNATNLNRQVLATRNTVGMHKTEAALLRVRAIDECTEVFTVDEFVTAANAAEITDRFPAPSYIADAIDNVAAKTAIIAAAKERSIPVVSCMGTGNKTDPSKLKISDIFKTDTCPLARAMRLSLKKAGITKCPVLWSTELPRGNTENENGRNVPGSVSTVPACAGIMIAAHIINGIISREG